MYGPTSTLHIYKIIFLLTPPEHSRKKIKKLKRHGRQLCTLYQFAHATANSPLDKNYIVSRKSNRRTAHTHPVSPTAYHGTAYSDPIKQEASIKRTSLIEMKVVALRQCPGDPSPSGSSTSSMILVNSAVFTEHEDVHHQQATRRTPIKKYHPLPQCCAVIISLNSWARRVCKM